MVGLSTLLATVPDVYALCGLLATRLGSGEAPVPPGGPPEAALTGPKLAAGPVSDPLDLEVRVVPAVGAISPNDTRHLQENPTLKVGGETISSLGDGSGGPPWRDWGIFI